MEWLESGRLLELCGLPNVGKTQVALHLAIQYLHSNDAHTVYWIGTLVKALTVSIIQIL